MLTAEAPSFLPVPLHSVLVVVGNPDATAGPSAPSVRSAIAAAGPAIPLPAIRAVRVRVITCLPGGDGHRPAATQRAMAASWQGSSGGYDPGFCCLPAPLLQRQ